MHRSARVLVVALVALCAGRPSFAASGGQPIILSHSGYLVDGDDAPVNRTATLKVRVWDALGGGVLQWEGTCASVSVSHGYYSVALGGGACPGSTAGGLDATLDTADLPTSASRWLEVEVDGTTLAPRLLVATVPTAAEATHAVSADLLGTHPASDFALATHGHAASAITGLAAVATDGQYASLQGLPSTFTPSAHTHTAGQVSGLATVATTGQWSDLGGRPTLADGEVFVGTTGSDPVARAVSGDATLSKTGQLTLTSVATAGTFSHPTITIDAKGRVTSAANGTIALQTGTSDPAGGCGPGNLGQTYFNTTDSTVRVCNGSAYVTTGAAAATPTDPHYASVTLLLHFDGANGSTTFTDQKNHAFSAGAGTPAISTTHSRFGGASLGLNGSSYIATASVSDWNLPGDFTMEAWIRTTSTAAQYQGIIGQSVGGAASNSAFAFITDSVSAQPLSLWLSTTGTSWASYSIGTKSLNDGLWHHVVGERWGNAYYTFIDGRVETSSTITGPLFNSTRPLTIGDNDGQGFRFNGWIDEVRITKGVARYTSAFAVPTAAFPNQ